MAFIRILSNKNKYKITTMSVKFVNTNKIIVYWLVYKIFVCLTYNPKSLQFIRKIIKINYNNVLGICI